MTITRTLAATTLVLCAVAFSTTTHAEEPDEGCYTGVYLGLPIEVCSPPIPDPTNCYTGQYQGAPQEVCLPTGEQLPEGTTFNGAPPVYHVSASYVAPTTVESAPVAPVAVADVVVETAIPVWLDQLLALLDANGGGF